MDALDDVAFVEAEDGAVRQHRQVAVTCRAGFEDAAVRPRLAIVLA